MHALPLSGRTKTRTIILSFTSKSFAIFDVIKCGHGRNSTYFRGHPSKSATTLPASTPYHAGIPQTPTFHHHSTLDDRLSFDSDFAPTHPVRHPSQATHMRGHTFGTFTVLWSQSLSSTKPEFSFTLSTRTVSRVQLYSTSTSRAPSPTLLVFLPAVVL